MTGKLQKVAFTPRSEPGQRARTRDRIQWFRHLERLDAAPRTVKEARFEICTSRIHCRKLRTFAVARRDECSIWNSPRASVPEHWKGLTAFGEGFAVCYSKPFPSAAAMGSVGVARENEPRMIAKLHAAAPCHESLSGTRFGATGGQGCGRNESQGFGLGCVGF